jgi:hypothetical protein
VGNIVLKNNLIFYTGAVDRKQVVTLRHMIESLCRRARQANPKGFGTALLPIVKIISKRKTALYPPLANRAEHG